MVADDVAGFKVGDLVVSYDVNSNKLVYSRVNNTEIVIREGVYDINNGLISPTDDHPLFVRKPDGSVGWAAINPSKSRVAYSDRDAVAQLMVGDYLLSKNGKWVEIYSIVYHPGRTVTYTFGVDSYAHDYFANGLLVSNTCECPSTSVSTYTCGSCNDPTFSSTCSLSTIKFVNAVESRNSPAIDINPSLLYR